MSETASDILSYEPREIALRLKRYIARTASLAEDHFEVPLIPAQAGNSRRNDEPDSGLRGNERVPCGPTGPREQNKQAGGQTGETSPERVLCDPRGSREQTKMIQHRHFNQMLEHIKRLEYLMRCFILFLTAELIALGRVVPSDPRARGARHGKTLAQKLDEELRDLGRDLPRLNAFTILTPVIKGKARRSNRRRSYTFLRDPLQLVDPGHLLARFRRLSSVLARADKFAMSLAARAVNLALIPAQAGISHHIDEPDSRLRGNERTKECSEVTGSCSPELVLCDPTGSRERDKHGLPNPLYFEPLAHFCPPADLWASACEETERRDVNFIHYLASTKLEDIGYGVRPDPYAGLPDLSCLDPPAPPSVRSL